eukprot:Nk52_evm3s634 gene=Nk52_evmTU3s634
MTDSPGGSNSEALPNKLSVKLQGLGLQHPLKILIVEDNPINLSVASKYLKQLGYNDFETATNGQIALDRIKEPSVGFDVIFMDLSMPVLNGHECAQKIKEFLPEEKRPTIIALTASDSVQDTMECLKLGFERYLSKPVSVMDLAAALVKCMPILD